MVFKKRGFLPGLLIIVFSIIFFLGVVSASDDFNVQRGTEAMTNLTLDITINEVNTSRSMVLLSTRSASSTPAALQVTGTLVNGTTLRLKKFDETETMVSWEVIESSGFKVQGGETEVSSSEGSINVDINETNLNESFIIITNRINSTEDNQNVQGFWTAEFMNSTRFNLKRDDTETKSTVSWQVVEWKGASVQGGVTSLHSGSKISTENIDEVNLNNSFIYTTKRKDFQGATATHTLVKSYFINETQIAIQRNGTSQTTPTVSWFVISHPDISVQHGFHSFGDTTNPQNIKINNVNVPKSFTLQSNNFNIQRNDYGRAFLTINLTNETTFQLQKQKSSSSDIVNSSWFVVEFKPPKITNPSDKISLEFVNKPSGFFTLNISEENETDKDLSGFISAGNFFKVNSTLINGDFNLTLTFDYDNSVANDNEVNVYFYNENNTDWQIIPDPVRDTDNNTISVTVDHFTLFTVLAEESKTSEESEAKTSRGGGGFCVTEWDCTEWSECLNETQTRTCSYPENWCHPREDKPEEIQACVAVETEEETPEEISIKEKGFISVITGAAIGTLGTAEGSFFISLIILLVAVVALISFDKSQRKSEKKKSK